MQLNICTPILAHPREARKSPTSNWGFSQGKSFPAIAPSNNRSKLSIEPVPANLAIAPHRYYLRISQGDRHWTYPLQFRFDELQRLLPRLDRLNLALNHDGTPIDLNALHGIVESWMNGGAQ